MNKTHQPLDRENNLTIHLLIHVRLIETDKPQLINTNRKALQVQNKKYRCIKMIFCTFAER